MSLKALAHAVLERNNPCNSRATTGENRATNGPENEGDFVAWFSAESGKSELRRLVRFDRELFEERAAIREFDGDYSREDAELLAAQDQSPALLTELDTLILKVAQFHNFTPDELREAREVAAGDVDNALTCFRLLGAEVDKAKGPA